MSFQAFVKSWYVLKFDGELVCFCSVLGFWGFLRGHLINMDADARMSVNLWLGSKKKNSVWLFFYWTSRTAAISVISYRILLTLSIQLECLISSGWISVLIYNSVVRMFSPNYFLESRPLFLLWLGRSVMAANKLYHLLWIAGTYFLPIRY